VLAGSAFHPANPTDVRVPEVNRSDNAFDADLRQQMATPRWLNVVIGGNALNIQRNIIPERILGPPKY
jgi:hypothetical protein